MLALALRSRVRNIPNRQSEPADSKTRESNLPSPVQFTAVLARGNKKTSTNKNKPTVRPFPTVGSS